MEEIKEAIEDFFRFTPRSGKARFSSMKLRRKFILIVRMMLDYHLDLTSGRAELQVLTSSRAELQVLDRDQAVASVEFMYEFFLRADVNIWLTHPQFVEKVWEKPALLLQEPNITPEEQVRIITLTQRIRHHIYQIYLYRYLPPHRPSTRTDLQVAVL